MRIVGTHSCWASLAIVVGASLSSGVGAQQVHVQTPVTRSSSSYHEHFGVRWGYNWRGPRGYFFFNNGGWNGSLPPFGGYDPNNAATIGIGGRGNNSNFYLNFTASQGSQRTVTGISPSLTLTNGYPGYLFSGQVTPFVTGFVPVVGNGGAWPYSPGGPVMLSRPPTILEERLARLQAGEGQTNRPSSSDSPTSNEEESFAANSSGLPSRTAVGSASTAEHGDVSLAEIRRQQAEEDRRRAAEAALLEAKGDTALAAGKLDVAKQYYRLALKLADAERRESLQRKLRERM